MGGGYTFYLIMKHSYSCVCAFGSLIPTFVQLVSNIIFSGFVSTQPHCLYLHQSKEGHRGQFSGVSGQLMTTVASREEHLPI